MARQNIKIILSKPEFIEAMNVGFSFFGSEVASPVGVKPGILLPGYWFSSPQFFYD